MFRFFVLLLACAVVSPVFPVQGGGKAQAQKPQAAQAWARAAIGSSELTVELPAKPEQTPVALEQSVRSQYDVLETLRSEIPGFSVYASYAVTKEQKALSLDGAARGALDRVKGMANAPDYKETVTNTTVLGMQARKIQCSFTSGEKKLFLAGLIFGDKSRMWQVICTGEASAANSGMSTRVLGSVKRK